MKFTSTLTMFLKSLEELCLNLFSRRNNLHSFWSCSFVVTEMFGIEFSLLSCVRHLVHGCKSTQWVWVSHQNRAKLTVKSRHRCSRAVRSPLCFHPFHLCNSVGRLLMQTAGLAPASSQSNPRITTESWQTYRSHTVSSWWVLNHMKSNILLEMFVRLFSSPLPCPPFFSVHPSIKTVAWILFI